MCRTLRNRCLPNLFAPNFPRTLPVIHYSMRHRAEDSDEYLSSLRSPGLAIESDVVVRIQAAEIAGNYSPPIRASYAPHGNR